MANEIACYNHPSQQAVIQCSRCGKGICKDCYDITGSWCCDCVREMSDTTTGNVRALAQRLSKEKKRIKIFSIIGAVIGLIGGIGSAATAGGADTISMAFGGAWIGSGIGAAIAWLSYSVVFVFKDTMAKEGFVEAVKAILGGYVIFGVIGMFTGPIFIVVNILKDNLRIKKCEKIFVEEEESLATLENILAGKQTNTGSMSAQVRQIVDNFQIACNGVSLYSLEKLKTKR